MGKDGDALALYNDVHTQATKTIEPSKLPVSNETIGGCERVLYIVMLYIDPRKGVPRSQQKAIKKRWEFIDSLFQEQQKLATRKESIFFEARFAQQLATSGQLSY